MIAEDKASLLSESEFDFITQLYQAKVSFFGDQFLNDLPEALGDFKEPAEDEEEAEDFKPIANENLVTAPRTSNYVFMKMKKNFGQVTSDQGNIQFNKDDIFFITYAAAKDFINKDFAELT